MKKAIVIINEQHKMYPQQLELLNSTYAEWETLLVPAAGWSKDEQKEKSVEIQDRWRDIVFASPVPYLLLMCAQREGRAIEAQYWGQNYPETSGVYLFHNDKREKKELPEGKIINVVSQTGWQLVTV